MSDILKIDGKNNKIKNDKLRLALDIGTNSIGWALYRLDEKKKPCGIAGAGVRIFSAGRESKTHSTLNATRRQNRHERRQRDRYLQRRTFLLHLLKKHGLFPDNIFDAKKLEILNPYKLRAEGLDQELDIHQFGRALFHLNQRRGFKSNRKSGDEKEGTLINSSVSDSQKKMKEEKARTYGELLWKRFQKMESSRKEKGSSERSQESHWVLARRVIGSGAKDNYVVYAKRSMIKEEFNRLWDSQARFHEKLKDTKLREKFCQAIFHQRNLKKPIVGICEFTGEKRVAKALPSFQRFRILKELNNLSYINNRGKSYPINKLEDGKGREFRDDLIKTLFLNKKKVKFSSIEKEFKKCFPRIDDFYQFNLSTINRDFLEGDQTGIIVSKIIPSWGKWSLEVQDRFVELLEGENEEGQFMKDDDEVLMDLENFNEEQKLHLSSEQLQECLLKVLNKLPSDHSSYSKTAIYKILPLLEEGKLEYEAISVHYGHHSDRRYKGELATTLPRYQRVLSSHCVEMSLKPDPDNSYKTYRIPNPTVHIAFNQICLVVNDIIRVYGRPMQVVVETARELPYGQKTMEDVKKKQKDNQKKNEEAAEVIREFDQKNNRDNRIRYSLWKEQKNRCLYSGKTIPKSALYTEQVEIDHILPFSQTLDDGLNNKVLVYQSENRNKGNQTPFEYFSNDSEKWEGILERVKDTLKQKQWRFNEDAMEIFLNEEKDFLARQLNDTRYISRYALQYLQRIAPDVWSVRGQTTHIISQVLFGSKKNRDDYRNHTRDALVVGLVDRLTVRQISEEAKKVEEFGRKRLNNIGKAMQGKITPWKGFKEEVHSILDKVVVSHRKRTKSEGALHNDTAYGFSKEVTDFSQAIDVFHYVDILSLAKYKKKQLEKVVSPQIKKDFLAQLEGVGVISKEFLIDYHKKTGIRRVRLKDKETVIPIKNKTGNIYKTFNGESNYAMSFFKDGKGKWDAQVIDTFTANQDNFIPISKYSCLMKGDMLFFDNKYWRVVKFTTSKQITLSEHFEANVDARNIDKKNEYTYMRKAPSALQKVEAKRLDISPCGVFKLSDFDFRIDKGVTNKSSIKRG